MLLALEAAQPGCKLPCLTTLILRSCITYQLQREFAKLLRDATDGLPVGGRKPVWEAGRPTVVHGLTAQVRCCVLRCLLHDRCAGWLQPLLL